MQDEDRNEYVSDLSGLGTFSLSVTLFWNPKKIPVTFVFSCNHVS